MKRLLPHRSRLIAATAVVASAALLTGCAAGASPSGGTTKASSASTTKGTGSGGTLSIGMTAANPPSMDTLLSGSQGNEGFRFVGYQLFDGLTRGDLNQSTKAPTPQPDLATSWTASSDATVWTFTLRSGVTFTDGTPFNADAVVFNLDRYFKPGFEYGSAALVGNAASAIGPVASYRAVDDHTVEITTSTPDAALPEDAQNILIASPTAIKADPTGFANHPVGTGPFVFSAQDSSSLTFTANKDYFAGKPKLDKLVLKAIPDPAQRTAAFRSGSVNWIEAPNPDDIASLQGSGAQIITNSYDHIWPWLLNAHSGPLSDVRVRQALNYAIDRNAMATTLLHGTADPAEQLLPHSHPAYTASGDIYDHDVAKAKSLLKAAGYAKGFDLTLMYPTSGSGNMEPTPMNEELQADLAKVGVTVKLKPVEWAALLGQFLTGKFADGVDALNISLPLYQESIWNSLFATGGFLNEGGYSNPKVDALLKEASGTVDRDARYKLLQKAAADITADAPWLFVVNDRNPRALSPQVHNFVEPQSWFLDLTHVYVGS